MTQRRFLSVLFALVTAASSWADISNGATRDEVLRQHGLPTSVAKRGSQEFFVYPKGGRVEFTDGKVTDVKGPLPPSPTPAATPAAPTPPAAAQTAPPVQVKVTPAPALAEAPAVSPAKAPSGKKPTSPSPRSSHHQTMALARPLRPPLSATISTKWTPRGAQPRFPTPRTLRSTRSPLFWPVS